MSADKCIICDAPLYSALAKVINEHCYQCGKYTVSEEPEFLQKLMDLKNDEKYSYFFSLEVSLIQHYLQQHYLWTGETPKLSLPFLDTVKDIRDGKLSWPSPAQQMDNLILYLGRNTREGAGKFIEIRFTPQAYIYISVRHKDDENASFLLREATKEGWVDAKEELNFKLAYLTLRGWQRYEELLKSNRFSKQIFVAMPFIDTEQWPFSEVYEKLYRRAVSYFGDQLSILCLKDEDRVESGNISVRIREEIKRSALVIADVTGNNHNVYFEAGYAEALEIPVIYSCQKEAFHSSEYRPGFDIVQHTTVQWEYNEQKFEQASKGLAWSLINSIKTLNLDPPDEIRN